MVLMVRFVRYTVLAVITVVMSVLGFGIRMLQLLYLLLIIAGHFNWADYHSPPPILSPLIYTAHVLSVSQHHDSCDRFNTLVYFSRSSPYILFGLIYDCVSKKQLCCRICMYMRACMRGCVLFPS